jgi:FtsP/CotA-like multicopper oxidase with cupredoxin domain
MSRSCWPSAAAATLTVLLVAPLLAQEGPEHLIRPGTPSGLPRVRPNDNTVPAGALRDGVREMALEVVRADWRVETPDGPGLRVAAMREVGGSPVIPAPLIRVEAGTRVRVSVRNTLEETVTVFGFHTRPVAGDSRGLEVQPSATRTVEFDPGEPGTYIYWVREGPAPDPEADDVAEREQLAGALVVDPVGGSPADRILVINIFSEPVPDSVAESGWLEALTINGLSWPFTERMIFEVGDSARWRVVNASDRNHPMHLHGFFYRVLSRGTATADTLYAPEDRRLVVTEPMLGMTTMLMDWSPTRPGRWLFHCHLSFHVTPDIRLPGAARDEYGMVHMAGLAVGIEVEPGPSDLVMHRDVGGLDLYANQYGDTQGHRYGFTTDPAARPDSLTDVPGPPLVFHQYDAVDVTVHNRMTVPTGVHWHGLELDAWSDGVPGWSRSDGRVSPVIEPGDSFTYRLSLMRPGTFIYHSHLNDIDQLTGGLYGPLIVLPEGESFDPTTDHIRTFGWSHPDAQAIHDLELNGRRVQPIGVARVGERHRFRVINIAPAGMITAVLLKDGEIVPITLHAKDGADLPPHQRIPVLRLPRLGAGETADFTWTPAEPGSYELHIGYGVEASLSQTWEVTGD